MISAKDFKPTSDKAHSETREALLDRIDAILEDCKLFLKWNRISIIVEHASEDMSVLNASDHLLDKVTSDAVQNPLKERLVVVQLERELELELETIPYCMVLATIWTW